jgi:metal-responsive CopG/Arc/MetJ family transcriptional regulator
MRRSKNDSFSIEINLLNKFQIICKEKFLNKSKIIEQLIRKFVESNENSK